MNFSVRFSPRSKAFRGCRRRFMTRRVNPRLPCGEEEERFGGDGKISFFFTINCLILAMLCTFLNFPHARKHTRKKEGKRDKQNAGNNTSVFRRARRLGSNGGCSDRASSPMPMFIAMHLSHQEITSMDISKTSMLSAWASVAGGDKRAGRRADSPGDGKVTDSGERASSAADGHHFQTFAFDDDYAASPPCCFF